MVARIAEYKDPPTDPDPNDVARHRASVAAQRGFCGGYHLLEPQTGHTLSLTMWENEDALGAAERAQGPRNGPAPGGPSRHSQPTVRLVQVAAVF